MEVQRIEIEYVPIDESNKNFRCVLYMEKNNGTEVIHVPLDFKSDETEKSQVKRTLEFLFKHLY